jgi:RNA polymerase sigma factor for flagellar operon FliA
MPQDNLNYAINAYKKETSKFDILNNREEIIINYLPKVKFIASRFHARLPSNVDVDDLISVGILGLIDAIDKFDENKKVNFSTYAEFRIKGSIIDELRNLDLVSRSVRQKIRQLEKAYTEVEGFLGRSATDEEIADFLKITLDEFYDLLSEANGVSLISLDELNINNDYNMLEILADKKCLDPVQSINLTEIYTLVTKAINELPEKEKLVISLYYKDEITMKEIGSILSVSESRVSQINTRAILRLRSKLGNIINT